MTKLYFSMHSKVIRNKINKKINEIYNQRQKILSEIKKVLDIEFNKISSYATEINIKSNMLSNNDTNVIDTTTTTTTPVAPLKGIAKNSNEQVDNYIKDQKSYFKIELPGSIIGNPRFYYKDIEIDSLNMNELQNLKKDLDYIIKEIEKEVNKILTL